jgi:predicted MPP superfamily phosphohydrolase
MALATLSFKHWSHKYRVYLLVLTLVWSCLSVYLAYQDWLGNWHVLGRAPIEAFKTWLFWASWASPLILFYFSLRLFQAKTLLVKSIFLLLSLASLVGTWARCIEPQMLTINQTTIVNIPEGTQAIKIALVSDLHLGLYYRQWHLKKLVKQLNQLPLDAVFFAGDWTYEPELNLAQAFAPLAEIKHRKFGVLGNHDLQKPGPALEQQLRLALSQHGVELIEGKTIDWQGWQVIGIDDLWGGKPENQIPHLLTPLAQEGANRRLVLTHQPDTVEQFKSNAAFLTMAGHTHGGQIQLPWLTRRNLEAFSRNPWYDGLYDLPPTRLLVSAGLGETGLPARLFTPPRIDLISLEK